jgi:2'-hydroxyisoflavone reductase
VGEAGAAGRALALAGAGEDRLQYLDVRDCAEFVLRAAEQRLAGCFNLIKPGIALNDWVERLLPG